MPRLARIVVPGVAHHVTQRGNRRMTTFFDAGDYRAFVDDLAAACATSGTRVLAWCLMPNHVHLVLVPKDAQGLADALTKPHRNHAWRVNRRNGQHSRAPVGANSAYPSLAAPAPPVAPK